VSFVVILCEFAISSAYGQGATVEQVLAYRPSQADVAFETPSKEEVAKCELKVDKEGNGSAWVLYGPQGTVIRRFVDTDGNKSVDQYRYFQHGLEVYRDVDKNENRKIDQMMWFNTGGTRWGGDADEDGRIDEWKRLSAEEASREAIHAMAAGDERALSAVLINQNDLRKLGISREVGEQILKAVDDPVAQMRQIVSGSKVLNAQSKWVRFDSSMLMPNLIPPESGKAEQDLLVYENVMAIVQNGDETGFVQVGEIVRVGEVWKLTGIPRPVEGDSLQVTAGGVLMQPSMAAVGAPATGGLTEEVRVLLEQMQKLDEGAPGVNASLQAIERYNVARVQILGQLAEVASSPEEREQWLKQKIDGIFTATQANAYPNGVDELRKIEAAITQESGNSSLVPYVAYRRLLGDLYASRIHNAEPEKQQELQNWWSQQLQAFVQKYPTSEDAPDAMQQLAMSLELDGKVKEARTWYEQLATKYREAPAARRAMGALRRLGLVGQPLALTGKALGSGQIDTSQYRGRVLLVIFWATWCQPCTEDLPQILAMYQQYRRNGFEVIGINVDSPGAPIQQYLEQYKVPWPHISEEGGLESRPALEYGVISLPTMILTGRDGKVATVSASVDELKKQIPELLKAR
jgi:thiol-disulfide isomerase/thioredoxin